MSTDLAENEVYCRDCGSVINRRAEICPECGIRQREPETRSGSEKNPGLAAVASFLIPGLGQVYNGQIAKGIIAGIVTLGFAITIVGLIVAVPIWIWLVYDAYKVAEKGEKTTSGGAPPSPRADIKSALTWYIENSEDDENAKEIRNRFRRNDAPDLPNGDKDFIMRVMHKYKRETGRGSPDDVRTALGR